jgi:hypothetical protein
VVRRQPEPARFGGNLIRILSKGEGTT